jgi:hypothetical protein
LRLALGELEHWPSAKIPGFVDGLLAAVPTVGTIVGLPFDFENVGDLVPIDGDPDLIFTGAKAVIESMSVAA